LINGEDWYEDLSTYQGLSRPRNKVCKLRSKSKKDKKDKKNKNKKKGRSNKRNARDETSPFFASSSPPNVDWPHPPPPNVTVNTTVPTLLKDHDLRFVVVKPSTKPHHFTPTLLPVDESLEQHRERPESLPNPLARSWVFVNRVPTQQEYVARNGAVYALNRLLHPRKPNDQPDEGDNGMEDNRWEDWEDWLPAWGDE
jgi:hypothetical protein